MTWLSSMCVGNLREGKFSLGYHGSFLKNENLKQFLYTIGSQNLKASEVRVQVTLLWEEGVTQFRLSL